MILLKPKHQILRELGERARNLRLSRNISQAELAARCATSTSSIRRFEASGQASLEVFISIAQSLNVLSDLEQIFLQPRMSIADLEKLATPKRQRARQPLRQVS